MRYFFVLVLALTGCTKGAKLGKYQYGLYYSEGLHDYSDGQRIAIFDSSIQDIVAQKNCESSVQDYEVRFPDKKGVMRCQKVR